MGRGENCWPHSKNPIYLFLTTSAWTASTPSTAAICLEDRYGSGSVLITAQLPVADWHGVFEDATVADATLDRLVHNAYRIELRGPSRRGDLQLDTTKSS